MSGIAVGLDTREFDSSPEFDRSRFNIHIHYSHHESKQDMAGLVPLLRSKDYDIYVPEAPGHDEHLRFAIEEVVAGNSTVYGHLKKHIEARDPDDSFWQRTKILYGARKIVLFPDFDQEEIVPLKREEVLQRPALTGDFTTDFQEYKDQIARMAAYFNARDERVAEKLPELLQQAVASNPELSERGRIGVLISIGIWHTSLGHRLARAGFNVQRSFQGYPHTYDFHGDAIRSLMFTGQVDDRVAIRGFIEQFFGAAFDCNDHAHRGILHRQIAERLTDEEIVEIVEVNQKDPATFFSLLAEKVELDKLLRSPKVKISPTMSEYRKIMAHIQKASRSN